MITWSLFETKCKPFDGSMSINNKCIWSENSFYQSEPYIGITNNVDNKVRPKLVCFVD